MCVREKEIEKGLLGGVNLVLLSTSLQVSNLQLLLITHLAYSFFLFSFFFFFFKIYYITLLIKEKTILTINCLPLYVNKKLAIPNLNPNLI